MQGLGFRIQTQNIDNNLQKAKNFMSQGRYSKAAKEYESAAESLSTPDFVKNILPTMKQLRRNNQYEGSMLQNDLHNLSKYKGELYSKASNMYTLKANNLFTESKNKNIDLNEQLEKNKKAIKYYEKALGTPQISKEESLNLMDKLSVSYNRQYLLLNKKTPTPNDEQKKEIKNYLAKVIQMNTLLDNSTDNKTKYKDRNRAAINKMLNLCVDNPKEYDMYVLELSKIESNL